MKKTTKKLVSLLLTLVLALSVSSISAFAINVTPANLPTTLAGNDVTWNGNWHATSFDGDVTIFCPYEGTSITSNGTIYWDGTTSYPNKVNNLTVGTYTCACGCNGSFTLGPTTPDWFDDVTANVDAVYDKLVATINGTEQTFAYRHPGYYTFEALIGTLENVSYSQDGNVYSISGQSDMMFGVFVITLDADGNVESVVEKGYNGTTELYSHVYAIPQTNNQTPAPEKKEEAKKNDKKTSPDTGATMGLGALGLGVALLTVLKKKED